MSPGFSPLMLYQSKGGEIISAVAMIALLVLRAIPFDRNLGTRKKKKQSRHPARTGGDHFHSEGKALQKPSTCGTGLPGRKEQLLLAYHL